LSMIGVCPECGKEHRRPAPCSHAVCSCKNTPVLVPLHPENPTPKRAIRFKRQHPLPCPSCLQPMVYLGNNWWECKNQNCAVINLHKSEVNSDLKIIKAAVVP